MAINMDIQRLTTGAISAARSLPGIGGGLATPEGLDELTARWKVAVAIARDPGPMPSLHTPADKLEATLRNDARAALVHREMHELAERSAEATGRNLIELTRAHAPAWMQALADDFQGFAEDFISLRAAGAREQLSGWEEAGTMEQHQALLRATVKLDQTIALRAMLAHELGETHISDPMTLHAIEPDPAADHDTVRNALMLMNESTSREWFARPAIERWKMTFAVGRPSLTLYDGGVDRANAWMHVQQAHSIVMTTLGSQVERQERLTALAAAA